MISGFDDRDIIGRLNQSYEQRFEGSWASRVSLVNTATMSAVEQYGILGANPAMRLWVGPRHAEVLAKKTYEIRNYKYEGTMVVPDEERDRDKTGLLDVRINSFAGEAGADHWEDLVITLINNSETGLCYDGQYFVDDDHLWGDSGTQKNKLTATEIPAANVATATAPTAIEMAPVIMQLVAHMMTFKNDKGRDVNGNAKAFIIFVATAPLFSACAEAIGSTVFTNGSSNPLRGLIEQGFKFEVKLISRLTSATDKIRMARADGDLKPFILQDEEGLETQVLGEDSDFHFDNDAIKVGVKARRGAGYGLWEHFVSVTLS
jgi:phage major head subunit gpT-like protein